MVEPSASVFRCDADPDDLGGARLGRVTADLDGQPRVPRLLHQVLEPITRGVLQLPLPQTLYDTCVYAVVPSWLTALPGTGR